MKTYRDFFTDVLAGLDIPPHATALRAFSSVSTLEGLNDRYNPLNSVVPHGNSTQFNSVGVQDYKSYKNGVAGTIALLQGEPWVDVVAAMRENASTARILREFRNVYATWNSHPHFPSGTGGLLDDAISGDHVHVDKPAKSPTHKPAKSTKDTPAKSSKRRTYKVKAGDTLYGIAGKTLDRNGRWREIAELNKIIAPYTIYPGQKLSIPAE